MSKKLYRSKENRMICGVCGGIAEYLNVDPTVVRLIWVLFSVFTAIFGGIIAYIIACIIIPEES
ncbi:phage shock protein C (PspC) family protein [Keratinibaculum paraultunense]|uniref:Phage shock protein C (PspC) family protein n=1 Tax=Keratinibaculum paraultunense TaxID=1278232 RepID=A0A4R3KTK4_9FIRM|nr:PspC domain-containing protein [Keratinibaculum paraultunense]QQY79111.1 PspC domain-containing protein [Keratinibaculum paraultunense]TCS88494.1 phage shock protein C (PspC) family protein [Keratinibaculum paraultunense]